MRQRKETEEQSENGPTNTLPAKLKELRLAHGFRQEDVAAAVGIGQAAYSNYEIGRRTPSGFILYRIANYYGLTADDLLKMVCPLDEDIYFDAKPPSSGLRDESSFLEYMANDSDEKLSRDEKELVYIFRRLNKDNQQEVLDFASFIAEKNKAYNRSTKAL